ASADTIRAGCTGNAAISRGVPGREARNGPPREVVRVVLDKDTEKIDRRVKLTTWSTGGT
ncbi:MAG: hypothetical protein Q7U56_07995, partial [Humidesulfovibrio sp.]|nr:hypothetical protein [Humidesulfovibrio sp.]